MTATVDMATVEQALRAGKDALSPSPSASLDAQLLLGHVMQKSRVWVLAHGDELIDGGDMRRYLELLRRRSEGEPVAYLRGRVEWYGRSFEVAPGVLIPRPETELLLEEALNLAGRNDARLVADVGTGTGVLAVEMALQLPRARVIATDISARAVAIARRNAQVFGVSDRVSVLEGDLLQPLTEQPDLIVANLPYLSRERMESLDRDVRHEPQLALSGGTDGLDLYRHLSRQMEMRGWRVPLAVELDPCQAQSLVAIFSLWLSRWSWRVSRDYAGLDRVVVFQQ